MKLGALPLVNEPLGLENVLVFVGDDLIGRGGEGGGGQMIFEIFANKRAGNLGIFE